MDICYPDYRNCIANLACSILQYYGIVPPNPTLVQADILLQKEYRNVVLLLLDGMGTSTLTQHLSEKGFFRSNLRFSYSSTFPPTTVAATTAVMSGLFPNQSGWLGWVGYFDEIDRNVVYFMNKDADTGEKIEDLQVANTFVPFVNIRESIEKAGVQTHSLASWTAPFPKTYDAFCGEIERLCAADERKFIYAYWEEPDSTMHKTGVHSQQTHELLQTLETRTKRLADSLQDTILIITADHGLIDVETKLLSEDTEIMECLVRPPSIEARALNLYVKPEMRERFELLFRQHYGEQFMLLSMEQVKAMLLFGMGKDHERLHRMLGDYLAVATGNVQIRNKDRKFIGQHAGLTADEMMIPLIAIEK